jgi:alpha-1,3-rhamnosyl/mannosyltransferase
MWQLQSDVIAPVRRRTRTAAGRHLHVTRQRGAETVRRPFRAADPSRELTIGIDARAAAEVPAGRGRVVRELLRELARRPENHSYRCYARRPWEESLDDRFTWELLPVADPWWNMHVAVRSNRECDVFLSSNSYLTTWLLSIPSVPIVYDLVAFDLSMRPNRRSAAIERATLGLAARRSAAFIAISHTTADALNERYPRTAARTTVAPLGVAHTLDIAPLTPQEGATLPEPGFVLAVGTLEPRKNLPRLVYAYRRLPAALRDQHPLVVVGARGWETDETLMALDSLRGCTMLGYVSDATLAELYRRCAVFCYPSLGEGFGLPVLEAMAAGAAVLTSNVSSLPEVGGDAVEYVDPLRVAEISTTLGSLLGDRQRRAELSRRAQTRAARFTWSDFAEQVLRTVEQAVEPAGASREYEQTSPRAAIVKTHI